MTLTANITQQELPSNLSPEQVVLAGMSPSSFTMLPPGMHSQQQQQQQYQQQQHQNSPSKQQQMGGVNNNQSPLPPVQVPLQSGNLQNMSPNTASMQSPVGQYSQEQLWESVKGKEAIILIQQKKLSHYRSWMGTIHARVQQMNPNVIKNARRLYIGSLPEGYNNDDELKTFFSSLMTTKGGCTSPGNPILSCKITVEKSYAFLEMRSVEETTNVMAFDGIAFKGVYLKIRRPSNYDMNSAVMLGPITPDPTVDASGLDICRSVVEDSPNKLFVGGLPCDWTEDQVKELLIPQGNLRSFNLVMDKMTGKSKGYAFCEFDEGATDYVIAALNQKKVGNKVLTVKRALEGGTKSGGLAGDQQIPLSVTPSLGRMGSSVPSGLPQQFDSARLGSAASGQQQQPNLMAAMIQSPNQHQQQQQQQQYVGGLSGGDSSFSPQSSSRRFNRNNSGRGGGNAEDSPSADLQPPSNMLQRNPPSHAGLGSGGNNSSLATMSPGAAAAYSMGIMAQAPFNNNPPVW